MALFLDPNNHVWIIAEENSPSFTGKVTINPITE